MLEKVISLFVAKAYAAPACPEGQWKSVFNDACYSSYEGWMADVWGWTLGILITLSVLIISAAGVIYMTAGGDEKRVATAKKMIWGVLSGVGLIILARVLIVNVMGLEGVI